MDSFGYNFNQNTSQTTDPTWTVELNPLQLYIDINNGTVSGMSSVFLILMDVIGLYFLYSFIVRSGFTWVQKACAM
jgi:hypothetical protein